MSPIPRRLELLDSIALVAPAQAGCVVVTGSHGGVSAAHFVVEQKDPPCAVIFNDAGVGKDGAGIVGLSMLQKRGLIGATYSHLSARIGEAADGRDHGVISHVNAAAAAAGIAPGMTVPEVLARLGVEGIAQR